jgi:hypothetical protein
MVATTTVGDLPAPSIYHSEHFTKTCFDAGHR